MKKVPQNKANSGASAAQRAVSVLRSLRLKILLIVVALFGAGALALTNHLIGEFEKGTRIGVLHEGLLISNFIESGVADLAERGDVAAIQSYLDRLVAIRERNDIEMNVIFLRGAASDIVASNVPDNIEAADPEEHAELLNALARGGPYVEIETEDGSVDPDDVLNVGPDHPDYYFKAGHRLVNITTPLVAGERALGSVNVKLSLSDLDSEIAVIHGRVGWSIMIAILALMTGLLAFLDASVFRPLGLITRRLRQFGLGMREFAALWSDRRDEIGALAQEFSSMAEHLIEAESSNRKYQENLKRLIFDRTSELAATQDATILSMASLAEYRDPETGAHIKRTQNYIKVLAVQLRKIPKFEAFFTNETVDLLFKSAPLHDIGKVGIVDAVLLKPDKLTDEEFKQMKQHPIMGRDAIMAAEKKLGSNSFLRFAREIAYTHHEKWDGGGYPQGLAGDDIPISGRLMAIADVYDALISRRCYKAPFTHAHAVDIIREGRAKHFDPDMVDAFLEIEDVFRRIAFKFAESPEEREAVSPQLRRLAAE